MVIIMILLFGSIDIARVINTNSMLENKISDIVTVYEVNKSVSDAKELLDDETELNIIKEDSYVKITLEKKIKPITPGIIRLSEKFFDVKVSRVIYDEQESI